MLGLTRAEHARKKQQWSREHDKILSYSSTSLFSTLTRGSVEVALRHYEHITIAFTWAYPFGPDLSFRPGQYRCSLLSSAWQAAAAAAEGAGGWEVWQLQAQYPGHPPQPPQDLPGTGWEVCRHPPAQTQGARDHSLATAASTETLSIKVMQQLLQAD